MQFNTFIDQYKRNKEDLGSATYEEYYNYAALLSHQKRDPFVQRQAILEKEWLDSKRPYYNVWPCIIPMMLKLRLDIPVDVIDQEFPALNLRMPLNHESGIKNILAHTSKVSESKGSKNLINGLVVMIDTGEKGPLNNDVHTFKIFPFNKGQTIEEAMEILPMHYSIMEGHPVSPDMITTAIKIVSTTILIGKDPELVSPDIITKDQEKYDQGDDDTKKRLIQKAIQRGKNGYDLGKNISNIPHYRRPHLAIVWTGKGRTIPKVVLRSGSIVHRNQITTIPTGTLG